VKTSRFVAITLLLFGVAAFAQDAQNVPPDKMGDGTVLSWWNPHVDSVTVLLNDFQEFSLVPLNRNSDSLKYEWLDSVSLGWNKEQMEMIFFELGDYNLTAIAWDESKSDTIRWVVSVIQPDSVTSAEDEDSTGAKLFHNYPNPFGGGDHCQYSLNTEGWISIKMYSIKRIKVEKIFEGSSAAGMHSIMIDCSAKSAGVYDLVLRCGHTVERRKFMLIK